MPKEGEHDWQMTKYYVKNKIKIRFVPSIDGVRIGGLLPSV